MKITVSPRGLLVFYGEDIYKISLRWARKVGLLLVFRRFNLARIEFEQKPTFLLPKYIGAATVQNPEGEMIYNLRSIFSDKRSGD